jgi:hypothetical protein
MEASVEVKVRRIGFEEWIPDLALESLPAKSRVSTLESLVHRQRNPQLLLSEAQAQ